MTFLNARTAAVATAALLIALTGASAGAQQDAQVSAIRDNATRTVVMEQLSIARDRGVPREPLLSKALEGVAKSASSTAIRSAMAALQKRLTRAHDLLGASATVDELSACADAIYVRVPDKTIKLMRDAAPRRSIAVELGVLTELVARGVSPKKASQMVLDLMARGATGAQLTALNAAVQSDVAAGLPPEAALERHGRGILSLLPPPPPLSNANHR
ncbi:MAG: hypothetical protein ACREN6_12450 [Gemmatimonadaceae bacterium]